MSINQLFEISRRSFRTYNASMEAASQNIANANTEGYHRRRVSLEATNTVAPGLYAPPGPNTATGNGVSVSSYERVRDRMLDSAAAGAQTGQGAAQEEARLLTQLEGALATGTDGALSNAMENFWSGWNDVANNPNDKGVRNALLSRAQSLMSTFHSLDQGISSLRSQTQEAVRTSVDAINERLSEVAELNETIQGARANGSPDLAAEDRRDTLVKELSSYAPVKVSEDKAGYTLSIQGMNVVQGKESTLLTRPDPKGSPATVHFGETGVAFQPGAEGGGKLGAQVRLLSDKNDDYFTLDEVQQDLDALAQEVVDKVNGAHEKGYDLNDDTGQHFFVGDDDPSTDDVTAGDIELAVTSPDEIAANGGEGGIRSPGDTTPARNIAALSDDLTPEAIDLAAKVGSQVERASAKEESQSALVGHLEAMAQGVSGVSIDEEMTNLIEHQQSFAASARVLNTAQSVMDTLLSM